MIIVYESLVAMKATTPTNGTIGAVGDIRYEYIASTSSWNRICSNELVSRTQSDPNGVTGPGLYLSDTKTGSVEVPAYTYPLNTVDVTVTNCNSLTLLCRDSSGATVGNWVSYVDDLGSTVDPAVGDLQQLDSGYLAVTVDLLGNSGAGQYPYGGVNFDFKESAALDVPDKPTVDVSTYTGFTVTYKSDTALKFQLRDHLSGDGASWFVTLPIAATESTVELLWEDFAQPAFGTTRDIPLSELVGLQFQYDTEQTTSNFTVYKVVLNGTGYMYQHGITFSNSASYTQQFKTYVDSWFSQFYEENVDGTMARIKWIDENHLTGDLTVSEGISYGMMLAAFVADSPSSPYVTKFNKLFAYWNDNLSSHGLMNWQIEGFTGNVTGSGSASDADIHVAQILFTMYGKFGDESHRADALSMLANIYNFDTFNASTESGTKRLIGPGDSWNSYCNPSYIDLEAIRTFSLQDPGRGWDTVYTDGLWLLQQNQIKNSAMYGLPSNWCDYNGNDVAGSSVKGHGYDACRVLQQLVSAYDAYRDPEVYAFLENIATNATLLSCVSDADPISACALVVGVDGTFGSHLDSLGMLSILAPMRLCATITELVANDAMQAAISNTFDDTDYFYLSIKSLDMGSINGDLKKESVNTEALETTYVLNFVPPDEGSNPYRMQVAFSSSGGVFYRTMQGLTWGPNTWSLVKGSSSGDSSGGVTGLQGTTGVGGAQGTTGVGGAQGTTGVGIQGATGSGVQGVTGVQGATGSGGGQIVYDAVVKDGPTLRAALESSTVVSIYVAVPGIVFYLDATLGGTKRIYGESFGGVDVTVTANYPLEIRTNAITIGGTVTIVGSGNLYMKRFTGGALTYSGTGSLTYEYATTTMTGCTQQFWDNTNNGAGAGTQGATGIQGVTGGRGATGISGVTGVRGVTGLRGLTGAGTQGVTGLRGVTGAMPSTALFVAGATGSAYPVSSIEVVTSMPDVSSRIAGRMYFLIG